MDRKEVDNFITEVEKKLELLKEFPGIGFSPRRKRYLRKTLIGKHIILIYRYNLRKNEIELIRFFDSRQNPGKPKK